MKGSVDSANRALLGVSIRPAEFDSPVGVVAWIDTGFNGFLIIPRSLIASLGLEEGSTTKAVLADGKQVELESFLCYVDWFGELLAVQVIANDGKFPLLGTEFLTDRRLTIDFLEGSVEIE